MILLLTTFVGILLRKSLHYSRLAGHRNNLLPVSSIGGARGSTIEGRSASAPQLSLMCGQRRPGALRRLH